MQWNDPLSGAEHMMEQFGCVLPYFPPNSSRPVCGEAGTKVEDSSRWKFDYWQFVTGGGQWELCTVPCKKMTTYFGLSEEYPKTSGIYQNRSYAKVYLKSTLQYTETVRDYPFTSMMAGKRFRQN